MSRPCKCDFCKLADRVDATIQKGDHREMVALINDLLDMYVNVDADLDYEKAVADGSWPQSVEILTNRLEKARERRLEQRVRENMPPSMFHKSPPPPDHVFKPIPGNEEWCELCDAIKSAHPKQLKSEFPRLYANTEEAINAIEFFKASRFSERTRDTLWALGVRNIGDMTHLTKTDILKVAGAKTLADIGTYLSGLGLSIQGE